MQSKDCTRVENSQEFCKAKIRIRQLYHKSVHFARYLRSKVSPCLPERHNLRDTTTVRIFYTCSSGVPRVYTASEFFLWRVGESSAKALNPSVSAGAINDVLRKLSYFFCSFCSPKRNQNASQVAENRRLFLLKYKMCFMFSLS